MCPRLPTPPPLKNRISYNNSPAPASQTSGLQVPRANIFLKMYMDGKVTQNLKIYTYYHDIYAQVTMTESGLGWGQEESCQENKFSRIGGIQKTGENLYEFLF